MKIGPQMAEIDRGLQEPPPTPHLASLPDVALIRVKSAYVGLLPVYIGLLGPNLFLPQLTSA